MTLYLTVVEALSIHADQISRYGGSGGVRDPGLLEAALFRPQSGYYTDLTEQAAALWESMAQNHPFINGLYRDGDFTFDRIVPWLRSNTVPAAS